MIGSINESVELAEQNLHRVPWDNDAENMA